MKLPQDFTQKMINLLDNSACDFFEQLDKPSVKGITANFERMPRAEFENLCDFDIEPIEHIDNGYYVGNFKFGNHIFNHLGIIYSQEPSAMYPVEMLEIQPDDIVLDVCASPGGKSIQILEKLNSNGLLVANEIVFNRAKILYENLSRMGFKNYAITCNSPEDYINSKMRFNKILIDAPCGGEGMLRKKDFDMNAYNPNGIETNAKRQLNILESVKDLLCKGGRLVYSTCTYDTRENEEVIAKFLDNNPEFRIVEVPHLSDVMTSGIDVGGHATHLGYRRYPHLCKGEGQFMIALEKTNGDEVYPTEFKAQNYEKLHNKELDAINKFIKEYTTLSNLKLIKRNDNAYVLPTTTIDFGKLNVIHIGCCLGSIQKNIFKPNHNFYHTYGEYFNHSIILEEKDISKFLHGEELDANVPDGYYVVKHMNVSLSGGKVTNNKLKNNYPKELRI